MKPGEATGTGRCEDCLYYDYDAATDCELCTLSLDQDEEAQFRQSQSKQCPYYRYYDEYTSVRRQI